MKKHFCQTALLSIVFLLFNHPLSIAEEADKPVIITAKLFVKEEYKEAFKQRVQPLIEATRKEEGCLRYEFYQDASDPTIFFFYEVYKNPEAQTFHGRQTYLEEFKLDRKVMLKQPPVTTIYDATQRK